jgi:glycosyltransferase involved in cell wall biosynthesis
MRIALVYDAVYPFQKGGGERRTHAVARELSAAGHDVDLYGMNSWGAPRSATVDGIRVHGLCRARPLYTPSGRRSIPQALLFGMACLRLLWRPFDVIDCCGFPYFSLFSCRLVAWLRGVPLVSTWHEVWGPAYWREYLGPPGRIGALVERLAVRMPDRIIAVSPTTARRLRAELRYRGPIDIVPNGFDPEAIRGVAASPSTVDAVFAGRLIAEKNVALLVRAAALLAADGTPVRCLVVGDGPERDRLRALARELGVTEYVTFAGALPHAEDVFAVMKAAKVVVLPSVREGFGMVALEANACGVPVLTVAHPANAAADLVEDGVNGWVVEPTVAALAGALHRAVGHELTAAALAGRVRRSAWPTIVSDHGLAALYAA